MPQSSGPSKRNKKSSAARREVPAKAEAADVETEGTEANDAIVIKKEHRKMPIPVARLSTRLAHILKHRKLNTFGDLEGMTYTSFRKFRNCGAKTVRELRRLVRSLERGEEPQPKIAGVLMFDPVRGECLVIPSQGEALNPYELPLSVRLESALKKKRINRLSELNGMALSELLKLKNCGRVSVKELTHLLERIAANEFKPASKTFSTSELSEMLDTLDASIGKLPSRLRTIIRMRMGAENNDVCTLEQIGSRFNLTRERIRQIIEELLPQISREGGPRFLRQLQGLSDVVAKNKTPLTSEQLAQWVGSGAQRKHPLGYYVRLFNALNQDIAISF